MANPNGTDSGITGSKLAPIIFFNGSYPTVDPHRSCLDSTRAIIMATAAASPRSDRRSPLKQLHVAGHVIQVHLLQVATPVKSISCKWPRHSSPSPSTCRISHGCQQVAGMIDRPEAIIPHEKLSTNLHLPQSKQLNPLMSDHRDHDNLKTAYKREMSEDREHPEGWEKGYEKGKIRNRAERGNFSGEAVRKKQSESPGSLVRAVDDSNPLCPDRPGGPSTIQAAHY
ncbi:hypothetical protein ACLOJK_022201 [Asimina triloba]